MIGTREIHSQAGTAPILPSASFILSPEPFAPLQFHVTTRLAEPRETDFPCQWERGIKIQSQVQIPHNRFTGCGLLTKRSSELRLLLEGALICRGFGV